MHIDKLDYNSIDELVSNTYIVYSDDKRCVIIDPGFPGDSVSKHLEKCGLRPVAILLTHGHFDHIQGVNNLTNIYHIPAYIHRLDAIMLSDPEINLSAMEQLDYQVNGDVILLEDEEELDFFKEDSIKVIHTPFHTKGSVCYYFEKSKYLFTGDTLFRLSVGRSDLPNACPRKMEESLDKIKKLPKDVHIYPGHGPNSVLESELILNHFLK